MNNFSYDFSNNLRRIRKNRGYTQKSFAQKLGYSEKTVSKWECGSSFPPLDVFARICEILSIDSRVLLKRGNAEYFLGIDGGGTKTEFLLCSGDTVIASVTLGESNACDTGMENSLSVLQNGIRLACGSIPLSSVWMHAGLAGFKSGNNSRIYENFFSEFGFAGFSCDSDNSNVIAVGPGFGDGLTVIMGTGFCIYKVIGGNKQPIGGWGYFFDEGGSAFNIGRQALSAYFSSEDGTGRQSLLTRFISEKTGGKPREYLAKLYESGKKLIATFAETAIKAAACDDEIAMKIIDDNIKFVADKLLAAAAGWEGEIPIKTYLAGGLTKSAVITDKLKQALVGTSLEINVLGESPVTGAVILAKNLSGEKKSC